MKNFFRVVRLAMRYRVSIFLAFFCSVMVGVLWGGSITTIYPVVEIVFRGDSLHDWADNRIALDQSISAELTTEIRQLEDRLQIAGDPKIETELALKQETLANNEVNLESSLIYQGYIQRYLPDDPFQNLLLVVAVMIGVTILKSIFLVINMQLVARISAMTSFELQNQLFEKTVGQDLDVFRKWGTSDVLARCTHYVRVVEGGVRVMFGKAVREPLKMLACIIGAALISWQLLLLCLVATPIGLLILRWLSKAMKKSTGNNLKVVTEIYQRLSETFNCIKAVKAFTAEDHERERFKATGREYVHRKLRMAFFRSLFRPTTEITGIIIVGMAVLLGAYLVLNQTTEVFGISMGSRPLSPGALIVFFGMLAGIADPVRKMSEIYASVIAAVSASDRIMDLIDREPAILDPEHPESVAHPHSELSFTNVRFQYRKSEPVLQKIKLSIPFGETVVFLGPNGCGKTTLLNLVPRFIDPKKGGVSLDGVNLRDMLKSDLRQRIGVVTQETLLFADTIANNIRYGDLDASDEMVIEAAKKAQAHEFIEKMGDGYGTFVGQRGDQLSGGQRQRIALARAILRNPEILILDEATSQIDVESEQKMHESLREFVKGRTSLIVSHRPSTLSIADRIVIMDEGQIVAEGTHETLYADCLPYRRLYESDVRPEAA